MRTRIHSGVAINRIFNFLYLFWATVFHGQTLVYGVAFTEVHGRFTDAFLANLRDSLTKLLTIFFQRFHPQCLLFNAVNWCKAQAYTTNITWHRLYKRTGPRAKIHVLSFDDKTIYSANFFLEFVVRFWIFTN